MKKKFYTCMVSAVVAGSILFSPISSYAADPTAPVEIEGPSQEETTTVEEISSQDTTETITEPKVFLIRERTKERIVVEDNDGPFTIGKSQKASYQILNNEAISRIHCRISWLNGELFIFDNDSTNHTFVQGNQIPVNIPYPIHNGEKIVMANETFTVEIRQ